MDKTGPTIKAPRIEVVLTSEADGKYDQYLVLHVPDENPDPTVTKLGGPYTREEAVEATLAVYTRIGEHHAFGDVPPPPFVQ